MELSRFSLRDGGLSAADAAVGSMPFVELISIVLPYFYGYETPADIAVSYWHAEPCIGELGSTFGK